jgi:hypothetical protein
LGAKGFVVRIELSAKEIQRRITQGLGKKKFKIHHHEAASLGGDSIEQRGHQE